MRAQKRAKKNSIKRYVYKDIAVELLGDNFHKIYNNVIFYQDCFQPDPETITSSGRPRKYIPIDPYKKAKSIEPKNIVWEQENKLVSHYAPQFIKYMNYTVDGCLIDSTIAIEKTAETYFNRNIHLFTFIDDIEIKYNEFVFRRYLKTLCKWKCKDAHNAEKKRKEKEKGNFVDSTNSPPKHWWRRIPENIKKAIHDEFKEGQERMLITFEKYALNENGEYLPKLKSIKSVLMEESPNFKDLSANKQENLINCEKEKRKRIKRKALRIINNIIHNMDK